MKKVAGRARVTTHVHTLRAAFAVAFDEQYPRETIALKEWLGHSRMETTMVYLRRKDKAKAIESTSGRVMPPAGFEPALPP